MKISFTLVIASGALVCAAIVHAQGFKFSQEDNSAKEKAQERAQTIATLLATPCATQLKDKKIMLIIGEQQVGGGILANQDNYGPHFQVINQRLRSLGLKTYTPEEIKSRSRRPRSMRISRAIRMPHCRHRAVWARASCCAD